MDKFLPEHLKKQPTQPETGGRITNETVAQHRERVLAGGRKFKYPLQYTKRRILIISIALIFVLLIGLFGFASWQLYSVQTTGTFIYRLTTVVPFPIARVNDSAVRYSDYLRELRSSIHYFSTKEAVNFDSDDGKRQLEYQKRLALNKSEEAEYIKQLARQNNVAVSRQEVNDFVNMQVKSNRLGLTEDAYRQIIRSYYDWSLDEYKTSVHNQLLQKKVAAKVGETERQKIDSALARLTAGEDFVKIAAEMSEHPSATTNGEIAPLNLGDNDPNGLIAAASQLQVGGLSKVVEGLDGFYIVRLLDKPSEEQFKVAIVFVSYKTLGTMLAEFRASGKIDEFIDVEPIASPTT